MKGLVNLGNTCYLNAALQCLIHVPGLTNYVLGGYAAKDVSRKRINASAFALEYIELVNRYWTVPEPTPLDTKPLWTALVKLHKPFASQMHDAHEAVTVVLKHLHDALGKTPRVNPSIANQHVDTDPWEASLKKDGYSMLSELFVGQTQRIVEAGTYRSVTHEHFTGLTLDLTGCNSVTQALQKSLAPETVDGYKIHDTMVTATLTKVVRYAPLILVLHLKRLDDAGHKIDRFVDYTTTLVFQGVYDLFGVCFHCGDHYVAACETQGRWHVMDDDKVTPIGVNDVVRKDAYVLMYKRRL